jgi:hypothetical protein
MNKPIIICGVTNTDGIPVQYTKEQQEEPDTDGSTKVAFELTTQRSGIGSQDWGMFCSVKPIWFVYSK